MQGEPLALSSYCVSLCLVSLVLAFSVLFPDLMRTLREGEKRGDADPKEERKKTEEDG
jgi:hypothetical protein